MNTVTMHVGDVRDVMAGLPDRGFDLLVTSPPFLALRSYLPADHPDKHREIGSEPTPAAFLDTLYGLTADWGRLLPEWGSICVELGDTMSGGSNDGGPMATPDRPSNGVRWRDRLEGEEINTQRRLGPGWPLAKSMCLIPHLYTIGLAYGHNPLTGTATPAGQWRIRNVVTWARPNPPVGSLGKRNPHKRTGDYKFRPACSYITVACRGTGRYFDLDAVRVEGNPAAIGNQRNGKSRALLEGGDLGAYTAEMHATGAPPLDWHTDQLDGDWLWKLATAPYPGAHYATYPLTLPRRLILAMCPLEVCRVCGWPRERMVGETSYTPSATYRGGVMIDDATRSGEGIAGRRSDSGVNAWIGPLGEGKASVVAQRDTLGFTDCGHDNNYRPGRVIDPFAGSGTTAVAAALEGRDCTLIDLDPRNVELVDRRLKEVCRILDRTTDGDTTTWTVEPESAKVLAADAAGQLELFGANDG